MADAAGTTLVDDVEVVLLDLDGTVYAGGRPVPGAAEGVAACRARGLPVLFVTNNASLPPEDVADHLRRTGVPASPDEVRTSSQAGARLLRERVGPGARVLVVGGPGTAVACREQGLEPVTSADDGPAAVLQGFGPEVGWAELTEAAYAIRAGALWVATNTDTVLARERGLALGNGSLVAAVRTATGAEPLVAGKPQRPLLEGAAAGRRALVVGDRLDTDVAGARAAGLPSLWVSTGVDDVRRLLDAAPHERPDHLGADLGALHRAPAATRRDDHGWRCGDAVVAVDAGALVARDGGELLDLLRAACAARWEVGDVRVPDDLLERLAPLDAR
ncbi:HAD-IIA family hydrolase [Pseudokineococcus basanitobsidens]|uniref:HAD-IIA family hydrolase n=1 Tax=Pseudokineococcus basanitobsidens TaxID=1926649 RepID=A0ABU8RN85_9ACTN